MKNLLISSLAVLAMASCGKVTTDESTVKNDLRVPAYPLVTIDPYASAWSAADNLYDAPVTHWTGKSFPFIGVIKVDGKPYRFMGTEEKDTKPLVPTSQQGEWEGRWTTSRPAAGWNTPGFNDSAWKKGAAAFGTSNEPTARTEWNTPEIWVRRTVEIPDTLPAEMPVYLEFSNDDDAIFYINGVEIYNTGSRCNKNRVVELPAEARAALTGGTNLLAAECVNPVGFGLLDFGLLIPKSLDTNFPETAVQTSADVQATQTHYTFTCGPVDLKVSFAAPVFLDGDLDILSRPVNYVNYKATATDGKAHDIEVYFEASPRWALAEPHQASQTEAYEQNGIAYLRAGSTEQAILAKGGDHVTIDWGYFYLAAPKAEIEYGVGEPSSLRSRFVAGQSVSGNTKATGDEGSMAIVRKFSDVKDADGYVMVGYDDICSIQYMGENLRPYWNRTGDKTIESQFEAADAQRDSLINLCYDFDRNLMKVATEAGGKKYADLLAACYRQSIAAHKLVESPSGELFFFSKENDSNGSIGTVDITYPTAPLLLYFNPELAKATMNFIYDYSESGRWPKPFAAHDVGTYPRANGQTYGGDMPVEESGNMILITAAVCKAQNDSSYAEKHWNTLTTWVDYLVENGLDPENQLCTDDFAGHFAHNVNLSAKAIEAIAAYASMADMLGKEDVAKKYRDIALDYAAKWKENAADGDHYRLTFDKEGTWSQKYNLVWDKMLGLNVFDPEIMQTEIKYYLGKQNEYGLPLDCREKYTKTDWVLWTASMAENPEDFNALVEPIYSFYNETNDRVPMSDWTWTDRPERRGFMARAVIGGLYMKLLSESGKLNDK